MSERSGANEMATVGRTRRADEVVESAAVSGQDQHLGSRPHLQRRRGG
jgi:hypothetical protein